MHRLRDARLRTKLLLALLLTSAVSIAVTVLALIPPLQARLERDRLNTVREAARVESVRLKLFNADDLRAASPRLDRIAVRLAAESGAHVAIFGPKGALVANSPSDAPPAPADAMLARGGRAVTSRAGGHALVVRPVDVDGARYTLVLRRDLGDVDATVAIIRGGLPFALSIGLLGALLLAVALSTRLVRRLERLRLGARQLRDEGLDHPLPADEAQDEVGEVTRAVEAMRRQLVRDQRARQDFLDTAAHELRTPIASLQGTLELLDEDLAREAPDLGAARRRAGQATALSVRMAQLTTDLLDLGRLDGDLRLRREPLELVELADGQVAEFAARAAGARARLERSAPDGAVWAEGDPTAVARILRVLVDNALRYGSGRIGITVSAGDHGARLVVSDQGAGVAPEEREVIFERFRRGTAGAGLPGFGLGLPIGRELARRMGGDLRVVPSDAGAAFELTLPEPGTGPDAGLSRSGA